MKCSLNGHNTRVLSKAINSFSRIGSELYLEATQNGLILRTVNDSQTAFAVMSFETGFFTDFKIDRSNSDEYCNKCKVSMKSCLGVFKNTRQVEKCQITLNLKTSKLLFQFNCLFDTIKTHNVSILEQESLNAVYMTDNPPNRMTAPNKMFTEIISNFRMYDNEITIEAATDLVVLKNNIDMHTDKHLMRTKLTLKSQEFTDYHISDPTTITFCLKELRAILNFADALSLDMTINFESAGKPVVFAFGSLDTFTANFVMSTLPPDDSSQVDRSVTRPITKEKPANRRSDKSLRNQSESRNLTISLSEVVDLDADGNVHIPPTMTAVPSQSTVLPSTTTKTHIENVADGVDSTEANCIPTTLATTIATNNNSQANKLNNRQRSRSPIHEAANTNSVRATASDEICVTFQPESTTANENVDEEMEVIPQSPQPTRRRRFKIFPRLYSQTQYLSEGRVLQENSDCEL
ncbi:cell cycle checkpoint control protein RAD9A [Bradysia coprophila]|uniref:cell cycle checkpoint control protein RAD9A n=1 Tax=Bradysia coprophila TaxID=38358 RepID=UPI00187DA326|nr:cell cycle checkpoint control protein RAD9A [Bradysia coprophila]